VSRQRRYPSDLTDAQWALIELLLPAPNTGGRPEKHPRRDIVDTILYVVRTGCARRQLPFDFPPWLAHRQDRDQYNPRPTTPTRSCRRASGHFHICRRRHVSTV
jgi:transposase